MADSQDLVAQILSRYQKLCAEHDQAQENVERVQAHQRELMSQINDCFAAARLFGFDLVSEFERSKCDAQLPILEVGHPILAPVHPATVGRSGPSIKSLILEATEAAYPNSVRAVDLRRELGSKGYPTHEKTVGMTLYRLSKKGLVRRVGQEDWFFVPESERNPKPVNGHKHKPQAELSILAAL